MPYCSDCGSNVEAGESFCPNCGQQQVDVTLVPGRRPPVRRSRGLLLILIPLVLVAVVAGVIFLPEVRPESPADVAKAFYRAGNEGNYAKAKGYLAPEFRMAFKMEIPLMPRFDNAMDAATKGGTITRIEVIEGVEYPGFAVVMLTLHYADGSQEQDVLQLHKVDGWWRILKSSLLMRAPFK